MSDSGIIKNWNFKKGFGFAKPDSGGKDVFIHITDLVDRANRPRIGQKVTFSISSDAKGRISGKQVRRENDKVSVESTSKTSSFSLAVPVIFILLVIGSSILNYTPIEIAGFYFVISVITFLMYVWDKSSAVNNMWRTKETSLHLFALVGGWPGAAFAQQIIRHKSKKIGFRRVFWITVILNVLGYCWLYTKEGMLFLEKLLPVINSAVYLH